MLILEIKVKDKLNKEILLKNEVLVVNDNEIHLIENKQKEVLNYYNIVDVVFDNLYENEDDYNYSYPLFIDNDKYLITTNIEKKNSQSTIEFLEKKGLCFTKYPLPGKPIPLLVKCNKQPRSKPRLRSKTSRSNVSKLMEIFNKPESSPLKFPRKPNKHTTYNNIICPVTRNTKRNHSNIKSIFT